MIKTKGQLADEVAKKITHFYYQNLGLGPRQSKAYIIDDMIIVRLQGKLLPIEEKILTYIKNKKEGIELVKNIRKILHQITTKQLSEIIENITQIKVKSIHSDISTKTGERVEIFVLEENLENKFKNH